MKLIDILIEHDVKWPEGAHGVVQDYDGEVKFYAGEKPFFDDDMWWRDIGVYHHRSDCLQTASDYSTALITKQEWENRKMNKVMFADVKVGDNVWDSRKGWGIVDEVEHSSDYPIRVDFCEGYDSYTWDGYYNERDENPSLFWDEIELKAPRKPLPKLEVDTKVIVWSNPDCKMNRHFSHFGKDGVLHAFVGGMTSFTTRGDTTPWDNWRLAE